VNGEETSGKTDIAVALVHAPVLNRQGTRTTTAVTTIDIHDFARSCAFYGVAPVYLVHPAAGMHRLLADIQDYWQNGAGARRNPARRDVLQALRAVHALQDVFRDADYQLWYTSASPSGESVTEAENLRQIPGKHLLVFGTGSGLDVSALPSPNGWLSPIKGDGMVRHLSVRAALAIYLDRLFSGRG